MKAILAIALLLTSLFFNANSQCHIDDWNALKALYESTNGDNWYDQTGWDVLIDDQSSPPANCNLELLYGINLDNEARIYKINLSDNQLIGSTPAEIGNLSNLKFLDLGKNLLKGDIPPEIGNLSNLETLDLSNNKKYSLQFGLDFIIPAELGKLTNLKVLRLSRRGLTGKIPHELLNLIHLRELWLNTNQISGSIPTELKNLSNLKLLYLGWNNLNGSIPLELSSLSNLEYLDLSRNQLSGNIPPEFVSLSKLRYLFLDKNQLNGSIPAELGSLRNLSLLEINDNDLSGCYPYNLSPFCKQLNSSYFDGNFDISDGNNFLATWEDFCASEDGICRTNCHFDDWNALKKLYESTGGDDWINNTNWEEIAGNEPTANCNLENLFGVSLDTQGRVNSLDLQYNQLSGNIPPQFSNLKNLTLLEINGNNIKGCYPNSLTTFCSQLTSEHFDGNSDISDGNNFDATWEDFCATKDGICTTCHFDDWFALKRLYESTNGENWTSNTNWEEITGIEPTANCNLGKLYGVSLNEYGRVDDLDLQRNLLNGSIPSELDHLSNLKEIRLNNNELSGNIPPQLGNLSNLTYLSLGFFNQLSGRIPPELGNLSKLTYLNLGLNQLSGSIPPELGNLSNLTHLDLHGNTKLSGNIPPELGNLSKLTHLYLLISQLSGTIPPELGNLTKLTHLYLFGNQLIGSIPSELGNLSNLTSLSLGANQLSGSIPLELSNLNNLENLDLYRNQLSGSIPSILGNLINLEGLELGYNQFSESIPHELGNLSQLKRLYLSNNQLSGSIPPSLGDLDNLKELRLHKNQLNGSIPPALGNLNNLKELKLHNNHLNGSIPQELGNLNNLNELLLSDNQLSGNIPPELSYISILEFFRLEHNYFSCHEIQNFIQNQSFDNFSYSPQFYKPQNYESIISNVFDTISVDRSLFLKIDFPFDTLGLTYQWFHNDDTIPKATQATLNFEDVLPNNAGKYKLHIKNEDCLPGLELISDPIYVIVKGYDLYGQPVEYDQIMVQFETQEETKKYEDEILYNPEHFGEVIKSCNCNRELYLWQFPSTEAAIAALLEIDEKTKRIKSKNRPKGGFNNNLSIGESTNTPIAYNVISNSFNDNYPDSVSIFILDSGLNEQNFNAKPFLYEEAQVDNCYEIEKSPGYSYVDSSATISQNYSDELWHGTFGFRSITKDLQDKAKLKFVPLKIFDENGKGNLFDMTCALYHAIDHNANIVNISAGYKGQPSTILESAINLAREKGVFITAAAGNDTLNIDNTPQYPAYYAGQYYKFEIIDASGNVQLDSIKYDNVISVASINAQDSLSLFSNYGKQSVTLATYGENIHSYGIEGLDVVASGSSMATYFATKALALEIAKNNKRAYQEIWNDFETKWLKTNSSLINKTQTGKQINFETEKAIIEGCTDPGSSNYFLFANEDDGSCFTTNIKDIKTGFEMFPNPSDGMVQLVFSEHSNLEKQILMLNCLGESILSVNSSDKIVKLHLEAFPKGIYFIRVNNTDKTIIQKLVLK